MIDEFSNIKKRNGEVRICQNEMEKFAYQTGSGQHDLGKQAKGELPKISFLDSNRFRFISFYLKTALILRPILSKVLFNII